MWIIDYHTLYCVTVCVTVRRNHYSRTHYGSYCCSLSYHSFVDAFWLCSYVLGLVWNSLWDPAGGHATLKRYPCRVSAVKVFHSSS